MADYKHLTPFIKHWEGFGGTLVGDSGGETRAGITYTTWKSFFGDTHDRFMVMSDSDWETIYKKLFWDQILGDQIKSQRIADLLVDWVWGSGKHYPELDTQQILNHLGFANVVDDGNFGPLTIAAINSTDELTLWNQLLKRRFDYLQGCVDSHPVNARFLKGWQNRLNNIVEFEATGKIG